MAQQNDLFTPLSTDASATVQGGCRSYRPYYYYSRPSYSSPSYGYGYGYGGGYGSSYSGGYGGSYSGVVTQSTNVNVLYND